MKSIAVIGAGYVGLVSGACFAEKGNRVIVVERDDKRIALLQRGEIPFYEPGLGELVAKGIAAGKLIFVSSIKECFDQENPSIIFSCVGTPSRDDGSADLSYVWDVAREIGQSLTEYCVIVNKSTVPVGTTHHVAAIVQHQLQERGIAVSFDVASNPEFLKEGDALNDCLSPDRIVIGIESVRARQMLEALYEPFLHNAARLLSMRIQSAELTKYASNAMLATRISFMNQMALLAEKVGADIQDIEQGMALDKRIGQYFLKAGIGYGGSCFPKDVRALVQTGREYDQEMSLIKEVDVVNTVQRSWFINRVIEYYHNNLAGKRIGVWGLSFKPETDDIRDAPAIDIIKRLLEHNAHVYVYDPVATDNVKALFGEKITYCASAHEVLVDIDCLVIATEWKEFLATPLEDFTLIRDKVIFDGRNCFDSLAMKLLGLEYKAIGRSLQRYDYKSSVLPARSKTSQACSV